MARADYKSAAVAAASVVAKVVRDRLMRSLARTTRRMGSRSMWATAPIGQGSLAHPTGPCGIHRLSFQEWRLPS